MKLDETRPPPKSPLMLRLVTEYEWRGKLNPGISDLGHSFRAICSLHLLYIVHEKAVWHPEKTVKTGPDGHPSDLSLSSGLSLHVRNQG